MTRRFGILLAAPAILFIVALGWLGRQLTLGEVEALRKERNEVIEVTLSQVSTRVTDFFHVLGEQVARRVAAPGGGVEAFREAILSDPHVRGIFYLDPQGKLLYPRGNPDESEGERNLITLVRRLSKDRPFLATPQENPSVEDALFAPWWQTVQWQDGSHIFLLFMTPDRSTVGIDVNRARALSDLFVELSKQDIKPPFGGSIDILTDTGTVLKSWGAKSRPSAGQTSDTQLDTEPDTQQDTESNTQLDTQPAPITRELSLAPPLQSFRLKLTLPALAFSGKSAYFNMTVGALLLGVLTGLLAVFAIREYRRELRDAETKISFVGKVSHELRTPLTNVRLYAELLEQRVDEDDEVGKQYLSVIISESERLSRLIGNVLRFGESDRGKLSIRPTPGDAMDVIRSAVELYRPAFRNKGMDLFLEESGDRGPRLFDADALSQIVHNLVSNAEKYARTGNVIVCAAEEGDFLNVEVSDEGPGVPYELRERIFEPFFRASNELTDGVAGTGIGLGIARELARLHGGDLLNIPTKQGLRMKLTIRAPKADHSEGSSL